MSSVNQEKYSSKSVVPDFVQIEDGVKIGQSVVFAGDRIVLRSNCRLDAGCVIGERVTIGQGAWVRAGAVVLRSIPPNAIVEGNPAQVVGYIGQTNDIDGNIPKSFDLQNFKNLVRPSKISLEVGGSALYLMRHVIDARGSLTVGEVPTEVPFSPARYFAVYNVPSLSLRGEHAHKQCKQFLICLHGSCRVLLDDGLNRCEVLLNSPDIGVFMPEMIWGTQYRYSADALLFVFASRPYEADDYLRTYDEFLAEKAAIRKS